METALEIFTVMRILFLTRQAGKLVKNLIIRFFIKREVDTRSKIGNFFYFRPVIIEKIQNWKKKTED